MAKSLADYVKKPKDEPMKAEAKGGDFSEMRLLRLAERVFEPSYDGDKTNTERLMARVEALKLLIAALQVT